MTPEERELVRSMPNRALRAGGAELALVLRGRFDARRLPPAKTLIEAGKVKATSDVRRRGI